MIRQPHRTVSLAWVLIGIGIVLPHSVRAQNDTPKASPSYLLVPESAKRIKAGFTLEVKGPKIQADEWSIYAALLPELPGQIDVQTTLFPHGSPARELSEERRPMLFVQIPSAGLRSRQEITARVEYEATLLERRLERREPDAADAPAVAPLDPKTRRLELSSGHQFDYQAAPFRDWLNENELHPKPEENEVDFARRAFLIVRKGIKHFEGEKVEHQASRVCEVGKSDFAGITAVYVAALRANGIPTRVLSGRMVIYEGQPTKVSWPHAKVEFFAPGIGWVPADVAGAIRLNRSPDGLEFFGNDSAEFLTTHLDTDLIINTHFGPKTLEWLSDLSWVVLGSGTFEGLQTKVTGTVEVEPLDLTEVLARKPARPAAKKPAAKPAKSAR